MLAVSVREVLDRAGKALAACDVEAILPLYTEDAVFEDVSDGAVYTGRAALRQMFEALFSPPETGFRVVAARAGEGWGALEWAWSGRARKSGVSFEVRGVSILEIHESRVARETIYYDPARGRA